VPRGSWWCSSAALLCDLGERCEALAYRADFEMYRAAHQRKVGADVLMDPEGE
jgi:hypothetical protein